MRAIASKYLFEVSLRASSANSASLSVVAENEQEVSEILRKMFGTNSTLSLETIQQIKPVYLFERL